jgi:hypothetical protein
MCNDHGLQDAHRQQRRVGDRKMMFGMNPGWVKISFKRPGVTKQLRQRRPEMNRGPSLQQLGPISSFAAQVLRVANTPNDSKRHIRPRENLKTTNRDMAWWG